MNDLVMLIRKASKVPTGWHKNPQYRWWKPWIPKMVWVKSFEDHLRSHNALFSRLSADKMKT